MPLVLAGLLALSGAAAVPPANAARAGDRPAAQTPTPPADPPLPAAQQADKAAYEAWMRSLVQALRSSANPRDRAFAAQTGFFAAATDGRGPPPADRATAGALLRAAAEAAPDDALVQSFWAQAEPEDAGCDAHNPCPRRNEALVRMEPDNVVAWLPIVDAAWARKDGAAVESALAQMAQARSYDDHMEEARKAWMDVFARYPLPMPAAGSDNAGYGPQARAYAMAMALSAAAAMPPFHAVSQSCHHDWHPDALPTRFRDCAQVGRMMLGHADSQIGRILGRALLRVSGQVTPGDVEMARTALWQQEQWSTLALEMEDPARFNAMVAESRNAGNEIERIQVELKRAGIPLTPPKGWQPRDSNGRPVDPLGPTSTAAAPANPGP